MAIIRGKTAAFLIGVISVAIPILSCTGLLTMEIDEVINAIYSGDADDACERLDTYFRVNHGSWRGAPSVCHRIPVAAQKAKNARIPK